MSRYSLVKNTEFIDKIHGIFIRLPQTISKPQPILFSQPLFNLAKRNVPKKITAAINTIVPPVAIPQY